MNFLEFEKVGDQLRFGDGKAANATSGSFVGLGDGNYTAGFRPNHLKLEKQATDALEFSGNLTVTEITGSETFIHLEHHGENWVGLVHGVKNLEIGAALSVYLDQSHVYIFAQDGTSVAPASYAAAA